MQSAKFNNLANDIVRPGIEKHLVPVALYRGRTSLGQVQAKWNFAIAMMHSEAEDFGDAVKLSNNGEFSHLCEPHTKIQHLTMRSFFARLADHPGVTNNIPGLTRYVRDLAPNWQLTQVPLVDNGRTTSVPWRIWRDKKTAGRPLGSRNTISGKDLFYPYVIHKPVKNDTYDMMMLVNNAVPKGLPDHLRADICQDLIVSLLAGEITPDMIQTNVKGFSRKVFEMHPMKYGHLSLDAPLGDDTGRTLLDVL